MSIKGYRQLTEQELAVVNLIKTHGETTGNLVEEIRLLMEEYPDSQRWASIAATHFQQGYMAISRAVTRPETFA